MNMDVVDQVRKAAEKGEDLGWLFDLSLPVLGGIVGTQIVHEMGHAIIALKDGVSFVVSNLTNDLFIYCSHVQPALSTRSK